MGRSRGAKLGGKRGEEKGDWSREDEKEEIVDEDKGMIVKREWEN